MSLQEISLKMCGDKRGFMTIRQWRESPGGSKETLNRRLRKQPEGVWSPEGLRTGFSSEDFLGFSLQQHGRGEKSIKEISNTK